MHVRLLNEKLVIFFSLLLKFLLSFCFPSIGFASKAHIENVEKEHDRQYGNENCFNVILLKGEGGAR